MGNVLAEALKTKLHENQPYPGDSQEPHGHLWFTLWDSKTDCQFKWINHDCGLGGEVSYKWVLEPQFSLGEFWGWQLAMFDNIPTFQDMDYP